MANSSIILVLVPVNMIIEVTCFKQNQQISEAKIVVRIVRAFGVPLRNHLTSDEIIRYCLIITNQNLKSCAYTVEPPIKDTPSKGHNRKNLSVKDTL